MERKRIAIYVRVSTEEQARTGYGLSDQERQCRKYAEIFYEGRLGDIELYKDDGYSAKDMNRPEVRRMMEDIECQRIDTVIVFKLDRLTRSVIDVYSFISKIMDKDCKLIAVLDHLDIHSANGRMFIGILSIIAQWEREVISERTRAGMNEMVAEGKYPYGGKRPYGWNITKDRRITINEKEADIIRWMAHSFLSGYSINQIIRALYSEKEIQMSWMRAKHILSRDLNVGIFTYHGKQFNNVFPPILEFDEYSRLCELLKEKQIANNNKYNYIFHRLVYCACGRQMEQKSTNKHSSDGTHIYYYYYCPDCKMRVSQIKLMKELDKKILLLNESLDNDENRNKIKVRLWKIENKKNELYDEFIEGSIDKDAYVYSINKVQKTENELLEELNAFDKHIVNIKELSCKERYKMAHRVIERIIVDPETQTIKDVIYKKK